jgi:hypothetical protein
VEKGDWAHATTAALTSVVLGCIDAYSRSNNFAWNQGIASHFEIYVGQLAVLPRASIAIQSIEHFCAV